MSRIAVIGAGAWGTALAAVLAGRGSHAIALWSHTERVAADIAKNRENHLYLPGIPVPEGVRTTSNLEAALDNAEIVVTVAPSEHLRATLRSMAPYLTPQQAIVNATKGLEDGTGLRMTQVIGEVLAAHSLQLPCCVLSGPSFAQEVAAGSPTAMTIAAAQPELAARIRKEFSGPSLRLYTNEDVVGVELGGALKNVIALASGLVTGLGLGHNSIAALITRGIAEMTRLAMTQGARRETLAGLSGLGDLVLTCTGTLSRNRHVGMELGRGRGLEDVLAGMHGQVAEGVRTTRAALGLAAQAHVEMPITEQVAAILDGRLSPLEAMRELMSRPGRDE
ncbi:MAG: NAD(P)H-dependent glycerol-3-phosphate dehydrogenase [Acidobacteriaceae bacterium]